MQPKLIPLAVALALAAPMAGAGNVSYTSATVPMPLGGYAMSLDDLGRAAVWVVNDGFGASPRIWSGPAVDTAPVCCVDYVPHRAPLFLGADGVLFGQGVVVGVGLQGLRHDPQSGLLSDLGPDFLPTGRGEGGNMLADVNGAGAVVRGNQVDLLPLPAGATRAWGYGAAGGTVAGRVAIGGLGYAAAFQGTSATLLHNAPSGALDINRSGQWAGFVGAGLETVAAVGGPGGLRLVPGVNPAAGASATIAINEKGQALAGNSVVETYFSGMVSNPVLFAENRSIPLQSLLPTGATVIFALDLNEQGQILATDGIGDHVVLTPQGTLTWTATAGGSFSDAAHWDSGLGFGPNKFLDLHFDSVATQTAWLDRDAQMKSLSLGSGSGRTTLELRRGALLRADNALAIEANGVLGGDGRVQSSFIENRGRIAAGNLSFSASGNGADAFVYNYGLISGLPGDGATLRVGYLQNGNTFTASSVVPGRIRVDAGQSLRVEGDFSNFGTIEVFGGSLSHAGPTPMFNAAGALVVGGHVIGRILARDATLRFENELVITGGQVAFSGGVNDVFGPVELAPVSTKGDPESQLIVSGRAEVTFWDAVRNNGELRVSTGSTATFFGLLSGAGRLTGAGTKFLEGGFAPGNSPALVQVEGDLAMGANSTLLMELGGTLAGLEHDKLAVQGTLTLSGGPLQVVWWEGFQAGAGDRFDLLDWGLLQGSFGAVNLPTLGAGLLWDTTALYTSGELAVMQAVPEPGAAAMLLAGLMVTGWIARRRQGERG